MTGRSLSTLLLTLCALAALEQCTAQRTSHVEMQHRQAVSRYCRQNKELNQAKVGVALLERRSQFFQDIESGIRDEAGKFGLRLIVLNADNDHLLQRKQVIELLRDGANALIISPSQGIAPAVISANQALVPVVTVDSKLRSHRPDVLTEVSSDNKQGGVLAARLVCKALRGRGEVALIDVDGVSSVRDRMIGFRDELARSCPDAEIVADDRRGYDRASWANVTSQLINQDNHIKALFAFNDNAAISAARAIDALGLTDSVSVVGYDATPEGREAVMAGEMYGDIVQDPVTIGRLAVDSIQECLNGRAPDFEMRIPVSTFTANDGK
jgi:ribose transport system substrate-binding protein